MLLSELLIFCILSKLKFPHHGFILLWTCEFAAYIHVCPGFIIIWVHPWVQVYIWAIFEETFSVTDLWPNTTKTEKISSNVHMDISGQWQENNLKVLLRYGVHTTRTGTLIFDLWVKNKETLLHNFQRIICTRTAGPGGNWAIKFLKSVCVC